MGLSELTGHLERLAWANFRFCDVTRDASLYAYEHAISSLAFGTKMWLVIFGTALLPSIRFCNHQDDLGEEQSDSHFNIHVQFQRP